MKKLHLHKHSGYQSEQDTANRTKCYPVFVMICIIFMSCNAVAQGISDGDDMRIDSTARDAIIDTVTIKLTELYVFPDIAGKMVSHIRDEQNRGAYDNIENLDDFVSKLTQDLLSVYPDGHLEIGVLRES